MTAISKRRLKPFRYFLNEARRASKKDAVPQVIDDEGIETTVTNASTIIVPNEAKAEERQRMFDEFVSDMSDMRGRYIMAIAVALD